ncbi:hypothetical protein [Streptomyces sp. NPDC059786]|uniref:hypothetical protein n=1 Tax=Streptomyces sp. NPDC059786 TaxID=3346946 RepID=UPI00366711B4
MAGTGFTSGDVHLYGLSRQFRELSDDRQIAGRILILNASGAIVDDVTLSEADVEKATNLLWAGNPANERPVSDADIEKFLADGGDV